MYVKFTKNNILNNKFTQAMGLWSGNEEIEEEDDFYDLIEDASDLENFVREMAKK